MSGGFSSILGENFLVDPDGKAVADMGPIPNYQPPSYVATEGALNSAAETLLTGNESFSVDQYQQQNFTSTPEGLVSKWYTDIDKINSSRPETNLRPGEFVVNTGDLGSIG